jgi:hypothetical protein
MTMRLAPIQSRKEFGRLLNERGLTGFAAEVGAHRGEFAAIFLAAWAGAKLYCVDHWDIPPGYAYQAKFLPTPGRTRRHDMAEFVRVMSALDPKAERHEIMRCDSLEAANKLWRIGMRLDFVHLDADHERPGIDKDLAAWWDLVSPGGILAGHDFVCPNDDQGGWGRYIQPAVLEFVAGTGLDVWLVDEGRSLPWSFYIQKPEA